MIRYGIFPCDVTCKCISGCCFEAMLTPLGRPLGHICACFDANQNVHGASLTTSLASGDASVPRAFTQKAYFGVTFPQPEASSFSRKCSFACPENILNSSKPSTFSAQFL